jgi:hypothetical protein
MSDRGPRNGSPFNGTSSRTSPPGTTPKSGSSKVTSLSDLPLEIAPARDLWPQIEQRLTSEGRPRAAWPLPLPHARYFAAAAALVAAVAVGILIGRGLIPGHEGSVATPASTTQMLPAAFIKDPRYLRERAQLLQSLNARIASLPPQSRQKVLASLATIHQSMREIQAALGREPGNALLQELLVDTYQDEMRVLTTVQEASVGRGEI